MMNVLFKFFYSAFFNVYCISIFRIEFSYDKIIIFFILSLVILTFCIAFILQSAVTLLPTTKQMAALIVVPKVISAVAESETIQKLPAKVLNLANEWIEELSPKAKTEE